jgi:hypothetical protein
VKLYQQIATPTPARHVQQSSSSHGVPRTRQHLVESHLSCALSTATKTTALDSQQQQLQLASQLACQFFRLLHIWTFATTSRAHDCFALANVAVATANYSIKTSLFTLTTGDAVNIAPPLINQHMWHSKMAFQLELTANKSPPGRR